MMNPLIMLGLQFAVMNQEQKIDSIRYLNNKGHLNKKYQHDCLKILYDASKVYNL